MGVAGLFQRYAHSPNLHINFQLGRTLIHFYLFFRLVFRYARTGSYAPDCMIINRKIKLQWCDKLSQNISKLSMSVSSHWRTVSEWIATWKKLIKLMKWIVANTVRPIPGVTIVGPGKLKIGAWMSGNIFPLASRLAYPSLPTTWTSGPG